MTNRKVPKLTPWQLEQQAKRYTENRTPGFVLPPSSYRPGVAEMRARIAERCGELQPYTHKQGWTL